MKIKIDENIPTRLVGILTQQGHDIHSVHQEGLSGRSDEDVWHSVQRESRFLITQDLDFSDVRRFAPGAHHGILLVRLRAPGSHALADRIQCLFETEDVESWEGFFVVATEHKLRIRRP